MTKTNTRPAILVACGFITVWVATASFYQPYDGTTPGQADALRISSSATANSGGPYVVTNAITGEDYDVIAPIAPRPTANSGV